MRKLYVISLFVCLLLCKVHALKVEITHGQTTPDPIAIVPFLNDQKVYTSESPPRNIGEAIAAVITNDLKMSGYFDPIDSRSFFQNAQDLNSKNGANLKEWRILKVRFLLYGKITSEGDKLHVEFFLVDVITGKKLLALRMDTAKSKWRKLAHMISDEVFSRVTDSKGMFNTRIAYVEDIPTSAKNPQRRIVVMDLDGHNIHPITNSNKIVLMPSFSPNGRYVAFLQYEKGRDARVELMDLETKQYRPLLTNIANDALNYSPGFSPDSQTMVFGLTKKGGASAICYKKLTSNNYIPLTPYIGINSSPCFSPDGEKIVFASDGEIVNQRCKENIFIMDKDGKNIERISTGEGKYSQPVWSPRGDLIAFTKQIRSDFYIGVMRTDGSGERLITHGYLVEKPSWSPNGRYVIYSRQDGPGEQNQIWMSEITGRADVKLKTKGDASDCCWSPLLTGLKLKD